MPDNMNWKTEYLVPAMENGENGRLIQCVLTPDSTLLLSEIHSAKMPNFHLIESFYSAPGEVVAINYCFRGRAEVTLKTGDCAYISNEEIAVDAGFARIEPDDLVFPAADYHGLAVLIRIQAEPKQGFRLDGKPVVLPEALRDKVREFGKPCLSQTGEETRLCFETIRDDILNDRPREFLMLDLMRTLFHITDQFPGTEPRRKYFSKSQVQIAKKVRELLTSDPGKRYSAAELAKRYGISETSLKNYFRGVYGCGYGEFQNEMRMKRAAELLGGERQTVSAIGSMVGFSNQSAFARAFHEYYGVTPVEYRRQQRISKN